MFTLGYAQSDINSIIPISLFFPRVPAVVISRRFPKARFIFFSEVNTAHPFGTLPKIEVWHHHAGRAAMFRRERFAIIFKGNKGLTVDNVSQRHVGGIATITISS